MRTLCLVIFGAAVLSGGAVAAPADTPAEGKRMCLTASHIDHTVVVNDDAVLYYMRDGKIWQNTLQSTCHGLKFENAFSEEIRGGVVCANAQMIRVLRRGKQCSLGDFTPYAPPPAQP